MPQILAGWAPNMQERASLIIGELCEGVMCFQALFFLGFENVKQR